MSIYFLIILGIITIFSYGFDYSFGEIKFHETTQSAGINITGVSWSSAWTDFNLDGFQDVFITNHGNGKNLFLNNKNGSFTEISSLVVLDKFPDTDDHGSSWADFDNDGDQDLIVLVGALQGIGEGPNQFFVNEDGILIDKALKFGLEYSQGRGRHPLWFDFDGDGLLDIMLFNSERSDKQAPTAIFQQSKQGFVDITKESEIKISQGGILGQVGNVYGTKSMELILMEPSTDGVYELSNIPFKNIRSQIKIPRIWASDVNIADFNGDLLGDIFLSNMAENKGITFEELARKDTLLINLEGKFIDYTNLSGIKNPTSCRSTALGDFDNDMDVDIYLVCTLRTKNIPNIFYQNFGNGTFGIVPKAGGAEGSTLGIGDGVSVVDYDNDGFLDLFVTNGYGDSEFHRNEGPNQLFQNQGNSYHWLEIDLEGTKSNRDGIGSSILVTSGNVTQIREKTSGIHFHAQDSQRIHFGLKDFRNVDKILVFWPSGMISEIYNIESNQILKITEPTNAFSPFHQIHLGINSQDVVCNDFFSLIIKSSNGKPACVKSSSLPSLIGRGWGLR